MQIDYRGNDFAFKFLMLLFDKHATFICFEKYGGVRKIVFHRLLRPNSKI